MEVEILFSVAVQRTSARSGLKLGQVSLMPLICSIYAINFLKLVIFLFKWLFKKGILRFSRSKSNFEHFIHPTSKQGWVQTVRPYTLYRP